MTRTETRRLLVEIRDELAELSHLKETLDAARSDFARHTPDTLEQGGIALALHDFYNGVENVFRRIALELGEGVPGGDDWHVRLLRNMALQLPDVRPPVIQAETRLALEEFLRFRHIVRHTYGHGLEWERVSALLDRFEDTYAAFIADVKGFIVFLEAMAAE